MPLQRRREAYESHFSLALPLAAENLLDRFNRDYACIAADSPELLRRAFETRYQVYCVENRFEDPQQHQAGRETDEFDAYASHSLLVLRPSEEAIGTVRLILPGEGHPESFSVSRIQALSGGYSPTPVETTGEVSRFSISKQGRHKWNTAPNMESNPPRPADPLPSLGLIQGLVRMSVLKGITHWCAVMEPKLLRMLSAMGIHFTPVGPLIEHHGFRRLCHCELAAVLKTVRRERPTFWEVITDGGSLA